MTTTDTNTIPGNLASRCFACLCYGGEVNLDDLPPTLAGFRRVHIKIELERLEAQRYASRCKYSDSPTWFYIGF